MDSRERYQRALRFERPDRVPLVHHAVRGAFRAHGEALEALYAKYPGDVLLSPVSRGPFAFHDCPRGRWAGGEVTYDDWGCGWLCNTPDYMGQTVSHPLNDWALLEDYRPPDPTGQRRGYAEDHLRHAILAFEVFLIRL